MQTGIIGLPQVGKTTLFKILTRAHFDPNKRGTGTHVGIAKVPDKRLDQLSALFKPEKTTYAAIEYVDVGGIVHDKAKDSVFFVQIREADALAHVVRLFDDPTVPHPSGGLNPKRDIESVELDLILNDLDQLARRIERLEKDLKRKKDPLGETELALLNRCKQALESEKPLRELEFSPEETKLLSSFKFLSQKPILHVLNVGEDEVSSLDGVVEKYELSGLSEKRSTGVVPICGKVEAELADLPEAEAREFMSSYELKEPGLDRLIHATYKLLGLISFFTVGEEECRAWTIRRGSRAVTAAGAIHTDIERGFIKAEVIPWNELLDATSFAAARDRGKLRLEGKEYIVVDGDIAHFRHSG
ncbi:MAG: redox-regulated ATPase YchF [Acidobacteria bacterium]|nr:redox-regulated ATPase YchF [Acidobacteriota bacterium]